MTNLNLFSIFFQYNFTFQARDLRLVLHQILEHIDTFDIQNMRTSLTIHIYLNRPPYDLQLDLGNVERNMKRILYHFLPIPMHDLFKFFSICVHFEACNPYHVERVEIVEYK